MWLTNYKKKKFSQPDKWKLISGFHLLIISQNKQANPRNKENFCAHFRGSKTSLEVSGQSTGKNITRQETEIRQKNKKPGATIKPAVSVASKEKQNTSKGRKDSKDAAGNKGGKKKKVSITDKPKVDPAPSKTPVKNAARRPSGSPKEEPKYVSSTSFLDVQSC